MIAAASVSVGDDLANGATVTDVHLETLPDGTVIEEYTDSHGNFSSETRYPDGHPVRVREALLQDALGFLADTTYLERAAPSAAEQAAQVAALTRQVQGLLRLQLNQYETPPPASA